MAPITLNARMNEVPSPIGPALILMCAYRGAGKPVADPRPGRLGAVLDALTFRKLRVFIAGWRDFYANPRPPAYQRELVAAAAALCGPGSAVIVDGALPEDAAGDGFGDLPVSRRDLGRLSAAELPAQATVVFVYPDPLGLSWGGLEAGVAAQGRSIVVVNGRRRMFLLDRAARRALSVRRLLAQTRIVELTLGLLLIPLSGILALKDRMAGRT